MVTLADIDECATHGALCAHGTCTNTFGSFVCTCGPGWQLAPDDSRCDDIDECARPDVCGPGVCRNLDGSYVCLCPEGYVAMPNGSQYSRAHSHAHTHTHAHTEPQPRRLLRVYVQPYAPHMH